MKTILIVEDDQNIHEMLETVLKTNHYNIKSAYSGTEALLVHGKDIDLIILDLMLPGKNGEDIIKELKQIKNVPVIITSAIGDIDKKLDLFRLGADDYVTKPFSPSELVARVDAVYRRVALAGKGAGGENSEEIHSGDFVLNLRNRYLTRRGVQIELTQVEFQIIEYFFTHPGTALSRTDILHHVWGGAYVGEEKIVDVNIRRLRMKVEDQPSAPKHIVTVWGFGYRWEG